MKYEIRQIDAWYYDDCWNYNETFHVGEFTTNAKNLKKAFCNALHNLGIVFNRGRVVIVDDGDTLEAQNRKDGEPLFVAIPMD